MPGKKRQELEFRYYEIPHGELVLALLGKSWIREYGNDVTKLHFHNLLEIGYCIDGEGEVVVDEDTVPYESGMLTVIPVNCPHTTNSRSHTKSYWEYLFLDPESILKELYPQNQLFVERIMERINKKARVYRPGENMQLVTLVRLIMDECRVKKNFSKDSIRGMLLSALVTVARDESKENQTMGKVPGGGIYQISSALELISRNYMEPISLKELADACSFSETHFRRLFTEYMNMAPMEYLNLVRIRQACDLMKKSNYTMEEVAVRVGYVSVSTFNRNFRKIVGTSPYQYKKNSDAYQGKLLNARISAQKGW